MYRVLIIAIALTGLSYSPALSASSENVYEMCAGYPDSAQPRTCKLYIVAALRFVGSDDRTENPQGKLCTEGVDADAIIPEYTEWLSRHPQYMEADYGFRGFHEFFVGRPGATDVDCPQG